MACTVDLTLGACRTLHKLMTQIFDHFVIIRGVITNETKDLPNSKPRDLQTKTGSYLLFNAKGLEYPEHSFSEILSGVTFIKPSRNIDK